MRTDTYIKSTYRQYLEDTNREMMGRVYLRTKQLQEAIKEHKSNSTLEDVLEECPART